MLVDIGRVRRLYGAVRDQLGHVPLSGHLFYFTNKTRTRLKALVWDGSGLWVCGETFREGRFRCLKWKAGTASRCDLRSVAMLVNGLDLSKRVSALVSQKRVKDLAYCRTSFKIELLFMAAADPQARLRRWKERCTGRG